jgi:uncharacterized protein (DUF4415 family)
MPKAIAATDDLDEVPELTEADFAKARPAREVFPDLVDRYRRSRGAQKAPTKRQVTIRLDQEIIEHFKEGGAGWQTRINDALKREIASKS